MLVLVFIGVGVKVGTGPCADLDVGAGDVVPDVGFNVGTDVDVDGSSDVDLGAGDVGIDVGDVGVVVDVGIGTDVDFVPGVSVEVKINALFFVNIKR